MASLGDESAVCLSGFHGKPSQSKSPSPSLNFSRVKSKKEKMHLDENCQALVPSPKPISPQSLQTQSQPSPTQFETQINPKGTGADTKIL